MYAPFVVIVLGFVVSIEFMVDVVLSRIWIVKYYIYHVCSVTKRDEQVGKRRPPTQ
jgi:hypothetical protein